jgi:cytochrome c553
VPSGWAGHENLYLGVVAPSCRSCHAQRGSYNVRGNIPVLHGPKEQSLEFNSFSTFAGYQDEIERMIYDEGVMPAAKQTFDRFWQSTQPVILDNTLYGGMAHVNPSADKYPNIAKFDFGDRRKPGRPIVASAGARLIAPGFPFDNYSNEDVVPGQSARLNGLPSQFAESTGWFLQSGPTTPAGFPSTTAVTTFFPDPVGSDITGGATSPYIFRLSVTNSLASYNDIIEIQQWTNSNRERIVFTDNNPATVDIFDLFNEISSSAGSCFNCHSNTSVNAEADSIFNLRDTSFHPDTDAARKRFAFDQAVSRIDCRHPESSLIVAKPSGYHHSGGTLNGFGFGQQNWERVRRWAIEGARFGDGVTSGCP